MSGTNPYITSAKGLGERIQKMARFADVQYCVYADIMAGTPLMNKLISPKNVGAQEAMNFS